MSKQLLALIAVVVLVVTTVVVGYPKYQTWNDQKKVKEAISAVLLDPASAKFFDFIEHKPMGDVYVNGKLVEFVGSRKMMQVTVNAKNSFGGYAGPKEWVAFFLADNISEVGTKDELRVKHIERLNEIVEGNKSAGEKAFLAAYTAEDLALMGLPKYLEVALELSEKADQETASKAD